MLKPVLTPTLRTDADLYETERIVLAAGAYSRPLAARLGSKLPLDTERGYHVMLPHAGIDLQRVVVYGDKYFGLTPMQGGLRLAGTVELASVEAAPNYARADNLFDAARSVLPSISAKGATRWMGCRPSLPASLPVLGPSPGHPPPSPAGEGEEGRGGHPREGWGSQGGSPRGPRPRAIAASGPGERRRGRGGGEL